MDSQSIIAAVAILLVIGSYLPYIYNVFMGKTKPHPFTWIISTLLNLFNYILYVQNGGGSGTFIMLTVLIMTSVILWKSLKNFDQMVVLSDKVFFVASLIVLVLCFVIESSQVAAVLATSTSILSFIPTVRKSWNSPHSETISTYVINSVRHILVIFSVSTFSLVTIFNPLAWSSIGILFTITVLSRRKSLDLLD
jgi:hypothetical protein